MLGYVAQQGGGLRRRPATWPGKPDQQVAMPTADIAANSLSKPELATICIVVAEKPPSPKQRTGRWTAHCNGELIVADSRQPFVDAARVLLGRGVDPASPLVMWSRVLDPGSLDGPDALRSTLGAATKLTQVFRLTASWRRAA
jgi:hypothetical protein